MAQPRDPEAVADVEDPTAVTVPPGGGPMPDDDVVEVHDVPAQPGQIQRQQLLLGADQQPGVEAPGGEEGVAADHRGAGQEAENGRSRQAGPGRDGAGRHQPAGGVVLAVGTDHHPARHDGDPGIGLQRRPGPDERPGEPPGVVVAERHERRGRPPDAEVAARRTEVPAGLDDGDLGVLGPEPGRGAVRRPVVDDDHRRPGRERQQPADRGRHLVGPVPGEDDDADVGADAAAVPAHHCSRQNRSGAPRSAVPGRPGVDSARNWEA